MSGVLNFLVSYWDSISGYLPGFFKASLVVLELTVGTVLLSWGCGLVAALGRPLISRLCGSRATFMFGFSGARPH